MYALKHLSGFKTNPAEASWKQPPEAPNKGYLAVKADVNDVTCCCGLITNLNPIASQLPFPQNKLLTFSCSSKEHSSNTLKVLFVPVINYPLSANRYYMVVAEGDHKGQVYTCSREENMATRCFMRCINDVKPKPFDHRDIYQQIEIIPNRGGTFKVKSVASDGFPPYMFRGKSMILFESKTKKYKLVDGFGVNDAVRLNFLKHDSATNVVAGKWYCPFIFVKEAGCALKDQMEKACYYGVTLTQHWQEVHNVIENRRVLLRGDTILREERGSSDGFVWFTTSSVTNHLNGKRIGLSSVLWERIKWEENRVGWVDHGADATVEVKFGSSVLVEKFSFQRLDGSVAFAVEFIHTDKIRTE